MADTCREYQMKGCRRRLGLWCDEHPLVVFILVVVVGASLASRRGELHGNTGMVQSAVVVAHITASS